MVKHYAYIRNEVTGQSVEIGGTEEQVDRDLKEMERQGLLTDDCTVRCYTVNLEEKK